MARRNLLKMVIQFCQYDRSTTLCILLLPPSDFTVMTDNDGRTSLDLAKEWETDAKIFGKKECVKYLKLTSNSGMHVLNN